VEESFADIFRTATSRENGPAAKMDALRRTWHRLVIAIGYEDMSVVGGRWPVAGKSENLKSEISDSQPPTTGHRPPTTDSLRVNNLAQTALAEAALRLAVEIAFESLGLNSTHQTVINDTAPPAPGHRPPATGH